MSNVPESKYNIMLPLLLACTLAIGVMIGFKIGGNQNQSRLISGFDGKYNYHPTGRVEELLRFIESKYVDSIDVDTLLDDAVYALIQNLDPHSEYLTPSEVEEINNQMEGHYRGIGIEVCMVDDTACIYKIFEASPAITSGLKTGDKIIKVNEKNIAGLSMSVSDIRQMLKVTEGNMLKLELRRNGKKILTSLEMQEIPFSSVPCAYNVNDSIMYIKVDRFASNTYNEFMEKVEKLFGKAKSKHLVIDLRGNPGGFLPEATNILSQIFEEKNKVLVTTKSKNKQKTEYKTTGKRFFNISDVAVLVDENSASAAELLAGALQDWDRGLVVGRKTYGKGLVQEQYDLNNGGAIRLTVAKYFTPSGRYIQRDYSDKFQYEDEDRRRMIDGDYFKPSIPKSKKGQITYKSLVKGRILPSGEGIFPDVFIPADSAYLSDVFIPLQPFFKAYFVKKMYDSTFKDLNTIEKIKAFNFSTSSFKDFLQYTGLTVLPSENLKLMNYASRYMRVVMASALLGDEAAVRIDNQSDTAFLKTIQMLGKSDR